LPQGASLANQEEKSGLKGIFCIMSVPQHTTAHAQYHGPVTLDQQRKGITIALPKELL
jgi:hypothetical protein